MQTRIEADGVKGTSWSSLLEEIEIARDPVHKDIGLTELELKIIDLPRFQSLRGLKQLGLTDFAYPGAVHNRFQHSLGTLFVAEKMVTCCNRNARLYSEVHASDIPDYEHVLIRVSALIHDLINLPFGHTLEDEGNLFKSQWHDNYRSRTVFKDDRYGLIKAIRETLGDREGITTKEAERFTTDLERVLTCRSPLEYDQPYVVDVVTNTICADLIDYISRDIYFTGLSEQVGDRFLRYLAVLPLHSIARKGSQGKGEDDEYCIAIDRDGKTSRLNLDCRLEENEKVDESKTIKRVVTLFYQIPSRTPSRVIQSKSCLSETIDMLRTRYSLAEKVYFHRTKVAASAMLIEAVSAAREMNAWESKDLLDLSDTDLISRLQKEDMPQRTIRLAKAFSSRRLYKPVFLRRYLEEGERTDPESTTLADVAKKYRDPSERLELAITLENSIDVSEESAGRVVVYCPSRDMNLKDFEMLVQETPSSKIKPLENYMTHSVRQEIDAIKRNHKELWSIQVLVDPVFRDPRDPSNRDTQDLAGMCEHEFNLSNGLPQLRNTRIAPLEVRARKAIQGWNGEHPGEEIVDMQSKLVETAHMNKDSKLPTIKELMDIIETERRSEK